jgi:hypothetical protein
MSGPIVRKYGFPNFEQIFGKRELEHGVDEPETQAPADEVKPTETPTKPVAKSGPKKKKK